MLKPNPLVAVSEYEEFLDVKEKKRVGNGKQKRGGSDQPKDQALKRSKNSTLVSATSEKRKKNMMVRNQMERSHYAGRLHQSNGNNKYIKQTYHGNWKSPAPPQTKTTKVPNPRKQKQRLKRKLERMRWGLPKVSGDSKTETSSETTATSVQSYFEGLGAFDWNATAKDLAVVVSNQNQLHSESEESDEEVTTKRKKLSKAEKRLKALDEEKKLKLKEKELLEAEENPNSPDHFERLLVGSPDSAELWIKYMGYHAVNADIEKARAVGRRALKRIDPQQSASKLDVWKALLNLEHSFSPLEVFKETFAEALKYNDDYAINTQVLKLYADSKNVTDADQLTNIMVKKYKDNVECWLQCQNALMSVGLNEKARNLLQKALAVMTKKNHITLISRFALLENKHGFPEQAQALFENLLTSFPQRLDLLSVYVDMLVKSQHIDMARNVLERAAGNTLPARKMKSIYTKWLAFEEAHGTPSDVSKVEKVAKKYVANILEPSNRKNLEEVKEELECEKGVKKSLDDDDDMNAEDEDYDSEL